ncbi:MAG: bifunctional hydroxymethylpyrimidine kinase/phosphomethylpyrimidine kinase [Deltaproteobacteria bacterium]|nr:bifunctional hydroxymethylpyrimidine kinase/phosphomethylpyrimidine kinase [Deltaproteobacteria bacterium]
MVAEPRVLSIAGSDPSGGAGMQTDIRTITLLGGYAQGVLTALTAQNKDGIVAMQILPADFVRQQLEAVFAAEKAVAVKTGMLGTAEIVSAVAKQLKHHAQELLVVDPVMVSTSGTRLLSLEGVQALQQELLPLAWVITPNIPEAEVLTGLQITSLPEAREAMVKLRGQGAQKVVLTGGHWAGDYAVDILFDGKEFQIFSAPFIAAANNHGTGCAFASALACFLARGEGLATAVELAKNFVRGRLIAGDVS